MKYGYFDEERREYVITKPDTPAPWCNYLGSPEYGAIISNNAGGYSFVKSGANGRIIRYHFNSDDTPGRYVYFRDNETGDFWSGSWQPVGRDLDSYKSEVRHGTAYSVFGADYADIHSEITYYVPLKAAYEVWNVKVTNRSDRTRKLSSFGYAEFTNDNNYNQDQVNLQYTLFITRTEFEKNRITQKINEFWSVDGSDSAENERFFGLAGAPVSSYCGDKNSFLGGYHGYGDPVSVIDGKCPDKLNYNGNACGALSTDLELAPEETAEFSFILGRHPSKEAALIIKKYDDDSDLPEKEVNELIKYWHSKLDNFKIETPSESFNVMVNTWNAYQCFLTFTWSRAASLIYCGERNGYGYRDTVQDIQGVIHTDPEAAKKQIEFMLSAQVNNGGGLPLVKFNHNPGHEGTPDDPEYVKETGHPAYRADDALWLFPTVFKYIAETGNLDFLDEVILFSNRDKGTVYDHLKRAIQFSYDHMGKDNIPAGLYADWNDCLRLGAEGESIFVAEQLVLALNIMEKFAELKGDEEYLKLTEGRLKVLKKNIDELSFEGDRYIRGISDKNERIGSKEAPEASMWLNPQSWAVISGLSDEKRSDTIMNSVHEILNTPYGASLMDPPYRHHYFDGARAPLFNPSTKENGGIFSQTQGWLILAEALLGHGNRAFEYFEETSPASMNDRAEIRVLEPYVHGQFTESKESPYAGRSHVHWLTGTASTCMVGCVEGICGIRPDLYGIRIAPSIPSDWKSFKMRKNFRGFTLDISVKNPDGHESGFTKFAVNGKELEDDYIPAEMLTKETKIEITM
ncbi:MAG: N,N'-diacetylchitobiose phosphorylase [Lachnospiraceae bacterium]|jgi:N,N'-diacetylchitobiose phosphorylase|nr:N,N'-diacetylchitobiose phosphorylase [Lachnospiraceae bacterium]MEE3461097.1 N,N'-diacetylchitobiose phosphorylase [Lachnospiraceae bacterium]